MYVIYEKTYIDRLGNKIEDELNLFDSDNIKGLLEFLEKNNVKVTKRNIHYSIKKQTLINDRYYIYKVKE